MPVRCYFSRIFSKDFYFQMFFPPLLPLPSCLYVVQPLPPNPSISSSVFLLVSYLLVSNSSSLSISPLFSFFSHVQTILTGFAPRIPKQVPPPVLSSPARSSFCLLS